MPQNSLSSIVQSIENPGMLVMDCPDATGAGADVIVYFNPTYARIVNQQFAPFQHVSRAIDGGLHIFQFSDNESLTWPIEFFNLPTFNSLSDPRENSMGYLDLLSFIRFTANYTQSAIVVYSPTGFVELMRYTGGLDTLAEADAGQKNTAQRANRWAGTLQFTRVLPPFPPFI